ncbi:MULTISPECIES: LuxR C-terminal-related transcriptional regulator [Cysteiniphilum]|uniref:HTH luxR-type domain-containing protein n=1 Tax=Cysteiniphilum litorale TaxID=2056700 RepID=A0A8J2Z6B1_9GAMM|nr:MULTISPECIES: LuxR C-terminal-related transcriptional regulator [Cysteiniphilum]GGG04920.1 hypothetical protein GCM10010995_22930 [Cysteiniphilum litorale]
MIDAKKLDANSHIIRIIPSIRKISAKFTQETNIHFSSLIINHCNGTSSDFCACPEEWVRHSYKKYDVAKIAKHRLITGINYWKRNKSQYISEAAEDARENFDMDARIDFIYRDQHQNKYYQYSFYANKKHADEAYRFYDLQRAKLLKFISYFNEKAKEIIIDGLKTENVVKFGEHLPPYDQIKRSYAHELLQENASFDLSDREFEVLILYASGCSASQIAKMLNKSINTVSTHLKIIRSKTYCNDKKSLRRYLIDHGWDGLERFFFSYIPSVD